jgi:hypothetical protein
MAYTNLTIMKATSAIACDQSHLAPRITLLFGLIFLSTPASAELTEKYSVSVGYSITTFDSEIAIRSQDSSIDKEVDLEDDLGFNSDVSGGWIRGSYRLADRHRLRLTFTPTRRSASVVTNKDLSIEDNVILAGANIQSDFQSDIFDIDYVYSFYKRPNIELGVSGGLYWLYTKTEITASGEIQTGDSNNPELRSDYQTRQKLHAPLPLLGLTGTYEINPHWNIKAAARYLFVSISDIKGEITSLGLATDYLITKHWGFGLSVATFKLDVEKDGIVFVNSLKWQHEGAQLYIVYEY